MNDYPAPNWSDYRAAVMRFTDAIDAVLERGRVAEKRCEQLRRNGDGRSGSHTAARYDVDLLPLNQRHVQRRMIQLTENLYHTFLGPLPRRSATLASTAPRALGSRNRI
jgi:hypothetical protein